MVTVGPTTIMEGPADAVLGAAIRIGSIRTARPNIAMLPRRGPWSGSSAGSGSGPDRNRRSGSRPEPTGPAAYHGSAASVRGAGDGEGRGMVERVNRPDQAWPR